MTEEDKIPPAGLHPRLVTRLLDQLESSEDFRAAFRESPEKALRSLGYTDPWDCMALKSGAELASAEQIRADRHKLEDAMLSIHGMICPLDAQAR